jgi:CBS domain-containing protein
MAGPVLRSIRFKLIVPLVAGLAVIAVAIAVLMRFVHQRAVDQASLHEVEQASVALTTIQASEEERLASLLALLEEDESLLEAFARGDRAALLADASVLWAKLRAIDEVTHWYFHLADPEAGVFLRVHQPELRGDVVKRPTFRRAVATGTETRGVELGKTAYAVRVVKPLVRQGKVIGYLELGTDIDAFMVRLHRLTSYDFGLLLDKRLLDRAAWQRVGGHPVRWDERAELLEVTSTGSDATLAQGLERMAQVPRQPALLGRESHDGRTWSRGIFPLVDVDGRVIGAVVERHEITALLSGVDELRLQVVVLVVLLAAALAALVIFLLETLVFEPVARMTRTLEDLPVRMARGDWKAREAHPRSNDELGRFETFLDRAIVALGSFVTDARRVTGRHRTVDRGGEGPDP